MIGGHLAPRKRGVCGDTDFYSNIIIQLMDLFHAALAAPAADVGAEESPNLNF